MSPRKRAGRSWVNPPARRKALTKAQTDALTAEWYARAARSGFKDIENLDGTVKADTTRRRASSRDPADIQARVNYYRQAEHYLLERKERWRRYERRVWRLHSEGLSYREAAKQVDVPPHVARHIIETIRGEMLGLCPGAALIEVGPEDVEVTEDGDVELDS